MVEQVAELRLEGGACPQALFKSLFQNLSQKTNLRHWDWNQKIYLPGHLLLFYQKKYVISCPSFVPGNLYKIFSRKMIYFHARLGDWSLRSQTLSGICPLQSFLLWKLRCSLHFFFNFIYLFIFRERGREGKREKHQYVVTCCITPTGGLACNPGMCPEWESNQRPLGS